MPSFVQLESPVPVIWIRYSGEVSLEERLETMRKAVERALETNCYRMLVDYRAAHSLAHSDRAAEEITRFIALHAGDRELRIAWLVRFDYQLNAALEQAVGGMGVATGRFRDRGEALSWLQAPQADIAPPPAAGEPAAATPMPVPAHDAGEADEGVPAPGHDAVAIVTRAADRRTRLLPAQYAAVVRMVEDLMASGVEEARIRPLAQRMLQAMDPNPG